MKAKQRVAAGAGMAAGRWKSGRPSVRSRRSPFGIPQRRFADP